MEDMLARLGLRPSLVLVLSVLAAGCGGEPAEGPVAETAACLEETGAKVTTDPNELSFVAATAVGGALKADLGTNVVTIAFGETKAEAKNLMAGYRRFAGKRVKIRQLLQRRGKAVLLWAHPPAREESEKAAFCLPGGRS